MKTLANLTNRKNQFYCITHHHDRTHIYPRSTKLCLGTQKLLPEGGKTGKIQAALTRRQMAGVMMILHATGLSTHISRVRWLSNSPRGIYHFTWLPFTRWQPERRWEVVGTCGREFRRIVLAACKLGAPAPSARPFPASMKRFSYKFSRQMPDLRYLPSQLATLHIST